MAGRAIGGRGQTRFGQNPSTTTTCALLGKEEGKEGNVTSRECISHWGREHVLRGRERERIKEGREERMGCREGV